jgi:O-methyltransferase domain
MSFFDYLDTNTELATVCNNAMTAMSATAMDALVVAYDYAGFERIVDVGGGHGQLRARILSSAPDA